MTRARQEQIAPQTTPYYHVVSRCVRRAFLCGQDTLTGRDYSHRKAWVVERLASLGAVFAIDIVAYAVMSNHTHLLLRVDAKRGEDWSQDEIIERWQGLYALPPIIQRFLRGETGAGPEREVVDKLIDQWRTRLCDISWFMRALNEYLARRANAEDGCTGRFWEGRFKSQALLDEAAVLTCMTYVDLNPVRAGIAQTPEESDFTSVQQRISSRIATEQGEPGEQPSCPAVPLLALVRPERDPHPNSIGITTPEYLELVDWAGRAVRADKRGAIPAHAPPILVRLGLDPERFLQHQAGHAATEAATMLGHARRIKAAAESFGRRFIKGIGEARRLYRPLPST